MRCACCAPRGELFSSPAGDVGASAWSDSDGDRDCCAVREASENGRRREEEDEGAVLLRVAACGVGVV